jgi:tRNA-2-methylthio-N6-dimethylallyladenosine synthase
MKFFIQTFGCQMNESDSERIAGILTGLGAEKAGSAEESGLIIVNTCAVREKSEEKLYSFLGRMAALKKKTNARIGVVGCVGQLQGADMLKARPYIDFVLGPDNYGQLPSLLLDYEEERVARTSWSREWDTLPDRPPLRENPSSAYVPIMQGCDNFCAYCIVPFARGREKCRPLGQILAELKHLAAEGFKEIQFLGQNVNSYRDPGTGFPFSGLLGEAGRLDGIEWIRFITSHPKNFGREIAEAMRDSAKVCRQLHLPIQAGSSAVLKRMNRGYTREDYMEKIRLLRDLMPDISLSTDIIVGFPGETDAEFSETLEILRQVRFTNIFSFRYSPRPQTRAAKLRDDVPFPVKRDRLLEVQRLQKQIQLENHAAFVDRTLKVLCSGASKKDAGVFSGRNEGAEVVNFTGRGNSIGTFVDVRITGYGPYSLRGEAADS